jgi:hypothetical protein
MMGRKTAFLAAAAAGIAATAPASAAVVLCTGANCVNTDQNVLITTQQTNVPTVSAATQSGVGVTFNSSQDALLNGTASGQASVSSADGLLNQLTFSLAPGFTFASAVFNLFPLPGNQANEASQAVISYFTPGFGSQTTSIDTNGQNFIGISGNAGELFTSVSFAANPVTTGIQDLRQLRLGGVTGVSVTPVTSGVPEPATWAMMLVGFGFLGAAMRRRKDPSAQTRVRFA